MIAKSLFKFHLKKISEKNKKSNPLTFNQNKEHKKNLNNLARLLRF